jgi:hypothetical protein
MVNPRVYIFGSGRFLGFSLKESGEDLPPCPNKKWIRLKAAELSPDFLRALPVDPLRVLSGIVSHGHHVTPLLPTPVLPAAHRQSA